MEVGRKKKYRFNARARLGKDAPASEPTSAVDLLSPALRAELAGVSAADAEAEAGGPADEDLALTGEKKRKRPADDGGASKKPRLSKTKEKALRKLLERREKKAQRRELVAAVSNTELSAEQAALLKRTMNLGATASAKQVLRQLRKEEKMGIDVTATTAQLKLNQQLLVTRKRADEAEAESSSDTASSEEDDGAEDEEAAAAMAVDAAPAAPAPAPVKCVATSGCCCFFFLFLCSYPATRAAPRYVVVPRPQPVSAAELARRPRAAPGPAARYVTVTRDAAIQTARLELPILHEEHAVRDTKAWRRSEGR